jgi:hypothetical protein
MKWCWGSKVHHPKLLVWWHDCCWTMSTGLHPVLGVAQEERTASDAAITPTCPASGRFVGFVTGNCCGTVSVVMAQVCTYSALIRRLAHSGLVSVCAGKPAGLGKLPFISVCPLELKSVLRAVSQPLMTSFPPWGPRFSLRSGHVGFMLD